MTTEAMTWDEFRDQAAARAGMHAIGGDPTARLAHLALGLCGEAGEYVQAVPSGVDLAVPELGDVAWYLAMIEHATGLRAAWPTFAVDGVSSVPVAIVTQACAVAECVKRPMQGRDLPVARMLAAMNGLAAAVYVAARFWTGSADGMPAVYAANIAKTKARFGEGGFTVAQARALDVEAPADVAEVLRRAAADVIDAPEGKRMLDAYDADADTVDVAMNNYRRLLVSHRALHVLLSHAEGGRLLAVQKYEAARAAWLGTREEMNELLDAERKRADAAEAEVARLNAGGSRPADGAPCTKCNGTGWQRLTGQRRRVLDAVRELGTASPSQVVGALEGVETETDVNRAANVCAWLEDAGLLERVGREGRRVMYRVAAAADESERR